MKNINIANAYINEKCCKIHENNLCNFLKYFGMADFPIGITDYGSLCGCT